MHLVNSGCNPQLPGGRSRRVHKADAVLGVLIAAALVATGVGVAKSDDWTGERTYRHGSGELPLAPQGPMPAGSAPARFEWAAPDNATGVRLDVIVEFTGQAVQGGSATIRVSGTAPDGSQLPVQTRPMAVAPGATSSQAAFGYNATWTREPAKVRDTQPPASLRWERPLVVLVTVERPGEPAVATYAFTASATGAFAVATLA
jgi:hypothetical protein